MFVVSNGRRKYLLNAKTTQEIFEKFFDAAKKCSY